MQVCGSVPERTAARGALRTLSTPPRAKTLPAELLRVDAQTPDPDALRYAAHLLARGCVIGIPTDTFYGLAADPFNLAAVDEIYRVKGRPDTRALPILVNSLDQAMLLMQRIYQDGQSPGVRTSLDPIDFVDSSKIKRIGGQPVKGVGRDSDDTAACQ